MADFKEIVGTLSNKLGTVDPAKMKGVNAVYQFDLTGDNGGVFHITVADGTSTVAEAAHDNPNITITMAADDFSNMLEGKLNATSAFMAGKLKVKGDMSLAMKLQSLLG
ncbi:MAG TPA: SCP2 sterol-binding domain-containing protein [Candidatus Limnocylindrales bacterium]|nr:SCP2 sterol-binding domain-containing protein [Candidatus Limnocylindrales bacterium]